MALEDTLTGIREASAKRIPADRAAIMHRASEELRASGIMDRVIKVGDRLPLAVRTGSLENLVADLGRIWRHPPGIDQRA